MIGRDFADQTIQLARARHLFTVKSENHVILPEPGTLRRTALDDATDGDTARRRHPVLLHISGIHLFGIDAQEALTIKEE